MGLERKNSRKEGDIEESHSLCAADRPLRTITLVDCIKHGDHGQHAGVQHLGGIHENRLVKVKLISAACKRGESGNAHLIKPPAP